MGVGSGVASEAASGVGTAVAWGDIVESGGDVGVRKGCNAVEVGAAVGVGDGTGTDEQAATTPAATAKTPIDIFRSDITFHPSYQLDAINSTGMHGTGSVRHIIH